MKLSTIFRSSALAGVLLAGVSSVAAAAPCVTAPWLGPRDGIINTTDGRNIASVCGVPTVSGGSQAKVFVTILGGSALYGNQLYFLGSPDDPNNPAGTPIGGGFAINPGSVFGGANPWSVGTLVRVQLPGLFNIGQSLSFAIDPTTSAGGVPTYRFYSGTDGTTSQGMLFAFGQGAIVYQDNRYSAIGNTPQLKGVTYGFGDINPLGDLDFNDMVFMVEAEIVPEPLTMTLVATGLAGIGAMRRRKNKQA